MHLTRMVDDDTTTGHSTVSHTIDVELADSDLESLLLAFDAAGVEVWVAATATIDGAVYEGVGLRLHLEGDDALPGDALTRSGASAPAAQGLPWELLLDKYVPGQLHGGESTFTLDRAA